MKKFALTIHPEKTRQINFKPDNKGKDRTFDFLGFTHYWGKGRGGGWTIKRQRKKKNIANLLKKIKQLCKENRHETIKDQYGKLKIVLRGHYQYFAVRCNGKQLYPVYHMSKILWKKWLNRRGGKRSYGREEFEMLLKNFSLPVPKIIHQNV